MPAPTHKDVLGDAARRLATHVLWGASSNKGGRRGKGFSAHVSGGGISQVRGQALSKEGTIRTGLAQA